MSQHVLGVDRYGEQDEAGEDHGLAIAQRPFRQERPPTEHQQQGDRCDCGKEVARLGERDSASPVFRSESQIEDFTPVEAMLASTGEAWREPVVGAIQQPLIHL